MDAEDRLIAAEIRSLLDARAPEASICPSEVARRLYPGHAWREAMPEVRRVALALAAQGRLRITQADEVLDSGAVIAGPIRLRRGPGWDAETGPR